MERKIGEVFELEGERYIVEKSYNDCENCSFDRGEYCYVNSIKKAGECSVYNRKDKLDVIFVKIVD